MTDVNLDFLLKDISPESPSGICDREYESGILTLEDKIKKITGTPKQEFGEKNIRETRDPQWKDVRDDAAELLSQCHHLQVAAYLTQALVHTQGIDGLGTGLALIYGYISRYWESFYPQLDPEDSYDPFQRFSILDVLKEYQEVLAPLMEQPLCVSRAMGIYSYRDIQIAGGKIAATDHDNHPAVTMKHIEAAFKDADPDTLSATQAAIERSLTQLTLLNTGLKEKAGTAHADMLPDFKPLNDILTGMDALMDKLFSLKKNQDSSKSDHGPEPDPKQSTKGSPPSANAPMPTGAITSREDVIRQLDLICAYYQTHEPGSPIPLLLNRARQLVQKNFIEILQDLAPDSAGKIKNLIIGAEDKK